MDSQRFLTTLTLSLAAAPSFASRVVEVTPVTNAVLMLHLIDGSAHHESLGNGLDGSVQLEPLDTKTAAAPASYAIRSDDDASYQTAQTPQSVGRKSKGREFVKAGGQYPYLPEHWIFLRLPRPMQNGKGYQLSFANNLVTGEQKFDWRFDERSSRSEAIHVNQIGFRPDVSKYAYLSMWLGDLGPLSLDAFDGAPFRVLDEQTGREAFAGKLQLRRRVGEESETGRKEPNEAASRTNADVWQCDFLALKAPGRYVLSVEGIGCSYPFQIGDDVYRAPTITVLRALYLQRCHTALEAKYTDYPRAACHTAEQSQFLQSTVRALDKQYPDGKQNDKVETTGEKRTVTFGWHDAGDWDHEPQHALCVETLLLAYQAAPAHWSDGESQIPESGNGIPDILDEAMWGANLYQQLQRADGGTSAGTFADWWPRDGQTSTTDTMTYYVYAPDPQATLRWATIGAQLSYLLPRFGKQALAAEYLQSAIAAWNWAEKNLREGDAAKVRDDRCQAAAALFEATGDGKYLQAFKDDFHIKIGEPLMIWGQFDLRWAAWIYALCDRDNRDEELQKTVVTLCRNYTDVEYLQTADKRAFRKGYNWWKDFSYGAGTNPDGMALMMADALSGDRKYLQVLSNNCDVTLGGNALNMTWITGLGARSPHEILRIEDWYAPWTNRDAPLNPVPGILIFGPHAFAGDPDPKNAGGPWDIKFNQATTYPNGAQWPVDELYFEDRYLASTNEFTVNDLATTVASLGYLRADAGNAARLADPK